MPQLFTSVDNDELINILNGGGIGVLPTDTVYGLVARAADPVAIQKMYDIKKRADQPGTLIASSINDLVKLGLDSSQLSLAAKFWPGQISVVTNADNVAVYLKQTRDSLAVRIPDDPSLSRLLAQTGPLMTTSANVPGQPTSSTIAEAKAYFGDKVDFYVDGGTITNNQPSTIIGLNEHADVVVFRRGAVDVDWLFTK
ncbi:MAG: L-threonylcarbamoyladenylate synthase [Candidatus Saccharimonas sp.]